MTEPVRIVEMAPRDGLQNEANIISTADKVDLVNMLAQTGLSHIEVTSFVSPKWVPQLEDAADVMAGITRSAGLTYSVLVPNMRGFELAVAAQADEIAVFASASEGFSQKNINCSVAESLARFAPVIKAAKDADIPVRGYVSCVTDCPYDGPVAAVKVTDVADEMLQMGCFEISLGDTIGRGTPATVTAMLDAVLRRIDPAHLAGHFHDTNGTALANIGVCLDAGIRCFDAAAGGIGGCPYAPGAKGNVATEAVVDMLHERGFSTGIDPQKLRQAAEFAQSLRLSQ